MVVLGIALFAWRNILLQAVREAIEWISRNSQDILTDLVAAFFWATLVSIIFFFRKRIGRFLFSLLTTPEYKQKLEDRDYTEKLYMQNLRAKIQQEEPKWNTDLYVPLTATESYNRKHLQAEMLLVTQRIRHGLPIAIEESDDLSTVRGRRADLLKLLRKRERLIVLGEPGSGKTVAMRQLALLAIDKATKPWSDRRLPLLVNTLSYTRTASDGTPQPLLEFLKEYIKRELPRYGDFLVDQLEDYLAAGRLLVLFDGINQMPTADYTLRLQALKEFAITWPRCKYIFTCRTFHHDPAFNIREVVINPLSEDKIEIFAKNYLGVSRGRDFMQALRRGERRILRDCRTPYFLALAIGSFAQDQVLPRTRAELFAQLIHTMVLLKKEEHKLDLEDAITQLHGILDPLALAMNKAQMLGAEVSMDWIRQAIPTLDETILQHAKTIGLIDIAQGNRIRFSHHILQEYFAANALIADATTKPLHLDTVKITDPWWTDTICLLTGLLDDASAFIESILKPNKPGWPKPNKPGHSTLWFAARCIASSSIS
ncbi:MAG: hypothetical protein WCD37_03190, partial [Chloroflexia bacterium]